MKVLIFGGTTEGRELSRALINSGIDVTLSVTTEYGRETVIKDIDRTQIDPAMILSDKLDKDDMIKLLRHSDHDYVIDATHPYAAAATKNIRPACEATGKTYYRLKRPESATTPGIEYVPDAAAAVKTLNKSEKKALLTTGSKDLELFSHVKDYRHRLFIRILPMPDSLIKVLDLGYQGSNIICMQGPFSKEMNMEIMKKTGVKILVTKDSGDIGGFGAKISAALSLGCEVIVIKQPAQEEGYTYEEIFSIICRHKK